MVSVRKRLTKTKWVSRSIYFARKRCIDGDLFISNRRKLRRSRPCCAYCKKLYVGSFQADHVIPLAIFKLLQIQDVTLSLEFDADCLENLQLLCVKCHRRKTGRDVALVVRCKKLFTAVT